MIVFLCFGAIIYFNLIVLALIVSNLILVESQRWKRSDCLTIINWFSDCIFYLTRNEWYFNMFSTFLYVNFQQT